MMTEVLRVDTADGLSLEAKRWRGGGAAPALCLHGLTRNLRDFEDVAPQLASTGRDVYALSFRGRSGSDRDPEYLNYRPEIYVGDVLAALDRFSLDRAVFVGTSLGGIVTMLTNEKAPERVAGAVINDVGPELGAEGLARIAGYVGANPGPAASLEEAAMRVRAINEIAFPGRDDAFWRAFARRTFRENADERWSLDYDPDIAKALAEVGAAPDLWSAFASLKNTPTLMVRGALSDLLTQEIIDKMRAVHPGFDYCEVPNVGHAPMLTEPAAKKAIETFLTDNGL